MGSLIGYIVCIVNHKFVSVMKNNLTFGINVLFVVKYGVGRDVHIPLVNSKNTKSIMWYIFKQLQGMNIYKVRRNYHPTKKIIIG